jgi:secondary thiamine-phosphate synthase enzyme|tara:strand:+ start:5775 stop:6179 length:405 start_codon:yes stop_codon:yes gene_type:complete
MQEIITISTAKKQELIDIHNEVASIVKKSEVKEGLCSVFAMHATAAIIINENADPNICLDLLDALDKLVEEGAWRHDNIDGNAASHIKATILGPSETIPVKDSKLQLGTWQSPMFVELDGPRSSREIIVQVIGD